LASDNIGSYSMPLEVYLQSAIVRGILVTNQDRLSNYLILREEEEVFSLRDAQLTDLRGKTMDVSANQFLIYMQQVFAIADLSPQFRADRSGLEHLYIRKDQSQALLGVGPFWVKGDIHLSPGALIHDLLLAKTMFIPVTNAILLDGGESEPRTYLINRTQISCLTGLGEN
jgi:hypothetical protein